MKPATFNCTPPPFCKALLGGKTWTVEVAREGWTVDTGWTKGGHSGGPGRQKSTAGVVAHALQDTHAKKYTMHVQLPVPKIKNIFGCRG